MIIFLILIISLFNKQDPLSSSNVLNFLNIKPEIFYFNPVSATLTKWSNTLKQFVGTNQQIAWVFLTILWGWHSKG